MRPDGSVAYAGDPGGRRRGRQLGARGAGPRLLAALLAGLAAAALLPGCRGAGGTTDTSSLAVVRYRYLVDPKDPLVHAVVEVENSGRQTVRAANLVVAGIGRNGEHRGESRTRVTDLRPGEKRTVQASFTNRARLATIEVGLEPASEAGARR